MQASAVPSIIDTHYLSMISTDNAAPNQAPMSLGHLNTSSDNISLIPIKVVCDILETTQHEQDINLIDDGTKSLPSDEKLDANQSKVSTPLPPDCNQPGEVLITTPLSSETDCSQ